MDMINVVYNFMFYIRNYFVCYFIKILKQIPLLNYGKKKNV